MTSNGNYSLHTCESLTRHFISVMTSCFIQYWPALIEVHLTYFDYNFWRVDFVWLGRSEWHKNRGNLGRFDLCWPQAWGRSLTTRLTFCLTMFDHFKVDYFSTILLAREVKFHSPSTEFFWKSLTNLWNVGYSRVWLSLIEGRIAYFYLVIYYEQWH